jgi:hypothetical protein
VQAASVLAFPVFDLAVTVKLPEPSDGASMPIMPRAPQGSCAQGAGESDNMDASGRFAAACLQEEMTPSDPLLPLRRERTGHSTVDRLDLFVY